MGLVRALRRPPAIGGLPIDEVFDRHHADVYRYLARRVPADVAEDLASETFVQAVSRAHSEITFEREAGEGAPVTAVVLDTIPTKSVDISFTP